MKPVQKKKDLIRSVDLKLARADFQVRTLCDQISTWTSQHPVNAKCELREERLGFRLILEDFTEPPPLDEWGLLLGECVHNLRSALDNLAFALSRLQCDPPQNPKIIAFPIYKNEKKFDEGGRSRIKQMPAEAASLIEQLQPFQRERDDVEGTPDTDALIMLQELNNEDKHRVPLIIRVAPTEIHHACMIQFYNGEDLKTNIPPDATSSFDALCPGLVLLEYKTDRPIAKVSGSFYGTAIVAIQTAHGRPSADLTLRKLNYYTALIVDYFRDFFD